MSSPQPSGRGEEIPDIDWVEIPAGVFLMGTDKPEDKWANDDEIPQHEVYLPTYYISRYPVTYQQFQAFLEAEDGFERDEWWEGMPEEAEAYGSKYKTREMWEQVFKFDNHPRENVSWYQAVAFCRWLTAKLAVSGQLSAVSNQQSEGMMHHAPTGRYEIRLPTEAEWEKAARGTAGLIYPYGNAYDPTKGNTYETGIRQTSAVGMFPGGASPYGVLDMSGNVWEWCSSLRKPYPYDAKDGREVVNRTDARVVRGGSFRDNLVLARAAFRHYYSPPDLRDYLIGFRVVCRPAEG